MISIVLEKATVTDLLHYFEQNADVFFEPLNSRVNIAEYAKKVHDNAIQFWAYDNSEKIGLLACYFNHPEKKLGYITTISIRKEFQGIGVGKLLLEYAINWGKNLSFKKIGLEVNLSNIRALNFYEKYGFKLINKHADKAYFELEIQKQNN